MLVLSQAGSPWAPEHAGLSHILFYGMRQRDIPRLAQTHRRLELTAFRGAREPVSHVLSLYTRIGSDRGGPQSTISMCLLLWVGLTTGVATNQARVPNNRMH